MLFLVAQYKQVNLNPRQIRITAIGIQVTELRVNTGAIGHMHTGVFHESNDMNRYVDYGYPRYEGACGNNYDWDHTDLGSGIFHERTQSSDMENITYSTPHRTRLHDYRDRNELNYESRYTSGISRKFEESQTSNRGEGSIYPAYSYIHDPHSSDYCQTCPSYINCNSRYRRVRFSDSSDDFENKWPYRDKSSQGAPANSCRMMKQKPKEPQTYDGTSDFKDYILHFEQVAIWNKWSDIEKAQQLVMCLRGQAQNILSDLTLGQINIAKYVPRSSIDLTPRDEKLLTSANCGIKDYISLNPFHSSGIRSAA